MQGVNKFKKEAFKVVINYLNEEEIKRLTEAFKQFDKENTGLISFNDFK